MAKQDKKDKNPLYKEYRIHLRFPTMDEERIKRHAKESNMTVSEFIRTAVNDKIRMIEHPELFNARSFTQGITKEELIEVFQLRDDKVQKQLNEKFKEIQNTLDTFSSNLNGIRLKDETETIDELLREHGELKPNKLCSLSGIKTEIIYKVLSSKANEGKYEFNIKTGGFKLK